ncbi:pyridoxamine 5'-phosphate oxidase family protein [Pseudonocardia eucalypti]|uniref:Pyridoxamine 5'-phosphate oxidase family protein n=1 Tax=Pseudonocardia eucalypti TaxID=648755 RepID=A0ABP9PUD0_9PSEU|nr:PPOX class probable FMN-dependent enzyme [Pseudonocardia eucalypti]
MPGTPITTLEQLREVIDEPSKLVAEKAIDHIDAESRRFIEACPFFLLATSAADGSCDVSPRGDPPGSVLVLDDRTVAFGDRKGNRRLDSLRNIIAQPQVGMLFLVPGMGETIRLNGTARIVRNAPYADRLTLRGVRPELTIEISVVELYLHCAKAFKRSALWEPDSWPERGELPTGGQLLRSQGEFAASARELDDYLDKSYRTTMY